MNIQGGAIGMIAVGAFIAGFSICAIVKLQATSPAPKPTADTAIRTVTCLIGKTEKSYKVAGPVRIWRDGDRIGASSGCGTYNEGCAFLIVYQDQCWVEVEAVKP